MPQRISPRRIRRPNGLYWVVSLGRKYTGGSRQRRYFRNRKEAKAFATQSEEARHKIGYEAFVLPMTLRAEAFTCWQRLKSLDCTLTQAVEFFIHNRPKAAVANSVADLRDEFLKSRKAMNCRPRTLAQYESYLRVICTEFGNTDTMDVGRSDIEDWLEESEWSPRTRKNYLVTLTTLLNYAVGRGYRQDNPAAVIERPLLDDRPVAILTVEQVKTLLRVTKESDTKMLPPLTISLFAGLRRSEFFSLDWGEIDLKNRIIEVKGIKAKTRQRRLVHIADNLLVWLVSCGKCNGPITPEKNIDGFSARLRGLSQSAAINPWPHNAMRHSFGSYFLGKTKDENLTATEMGNSPGVVIRHYRALVKETDVANYWRLCPDNICSS